MASKQISYCSLEEAWGNDYADLYKKDEDMLTKMPEFNDEQNNNILNDRNITKVSKPINKNNINSDLDEEMSQYYMDIKGELNTEKNNELTTTENCNNILEHILDCEGCKHKLNKLLNNSSSNNSIIEKFNFTKNMDENYLDILIIFLIGIFIIFMLDCFVKLAKKINVI